MIANLPMYHRPELVEAHNSYWTLIRKHLTKAGIASPQELSQDAGEMEIWLKPDLVLSQTCGMPYRTLIHDQVTLIGTPDFGIKGCPSGYYRSAFVVPKHETRENLADFKDALFTYNAEISQSGFSAARAECKKHGFFFENKICSGGHLNSAKLVAECRADIATIDPVSLALMQRYDDFYDELKILCWTDPTPSLPYISALGANKDLFFSALKAAIDELSNETRDALMIKDLIDIPRNTYLAVR